MAPKHSDLSYPDFARYLVTAIKALKKEGLVNLTDLEKVVVGFITSSETDKLDAIGDRIVYEVDDLCIPKHVLLVSWLNPFGVVSHHPKLVLRLANFLLGHTTRQEIDQLPPKLRADLGV